MTPIDKPAWDALRLKPTVQGVTVRVDAAALVQLLEDYTALRDKSVQLRAVLEQIDGVVHLTVETIHLLESRQRHDYNTFPTSTEGTLYALGILRKNAQQLLDESKTSQVKT
jgi:hypothetical protein